MVITLDADWISDISMDKYSVQTDPSGNTSKTCISQTRFSRYLTIIESRLSKDGLLDSNGTIASENEYLAAYLICDLIQRGPVTAAGMKSENFGGSYTYTKTDAAADSVKSSFMLNYEAELSSRNRGTYPTDGAVRIDYEIEFSKLSQGDVPQIADTSENYPEGL